MQLGALCQLPTYLLLIRLPRKLPLHVWVFEALQHTEIKHLSGVSCGFIFMQLNQQQLL